ncbi:MAG TPA: putative baseplate assembly protein [Actinomycetota bacterium]|nr:putative baseplate assembly protein [Actinomycetota bacterium]
MASADREARECRPDLETCGCCAGELHAPPLFNRPGLPALRYRVGTHASFLDHMLRALPSQTVPSAPGAADLAHPLERLGTRSPDDPSVALIDAWAVVSDVLTFYQERIANEGYVRTATERRSLLELARAIGYELNPGVAASTHLTFTVDDSPGGAATVDIPAGTKVQSVPTPGALPQTFETVEAVAARPAWNAIRPQLTETWRPKKGHTSMYVKGVDTQLQPGDAILIVGQERIDHPGTEAWDVRVLQRVQPDIGKDRTLLDWAVPDGVTLEPGQQSRGPLGGKVTNPTDQAPQVHALRSHAALFGYNAPEWKTLPEDTRKQIDPKGYPGRNQWPHFSIQRDPPVIYLDAAYPKVLPGGWIVLTREGWTELYRAELVSVRARTDYSISAKVTRVLLDTDEHLNFFGLRNTGVLAQSETLEAVGQPKTEAVQGDTIVLDGLVDGLEPGQALAFMVQRAPEETMAPPDGEIAFIESVTVDAEGTHTVVQLTKPLAKVYARSTLLINVNTAPATHGETVKEVLGSGDATAANQSFTLKRAPLTYVAASTPTGARSTLAVSVDDVEWGESPSLYGRSPRDRVYIIRTSDDGRSSVTFGDGTAGQRLPTGQANLVATYRTGIGPDGQVAAGALTLLQTRPLGVRSVENPVDATGAAAAERLDDARTNAPLTVLTLDRMVSLVDYEDFVRSFAGIGKSQASALWLGSSHIVHVTVAAEGGDDVDPTSDLFLNLLVAIDGARDPVVEVRIQSFRRVSFHIGARVMIQRDRLAEDVLELVKTRLRDEFAFERRAFGQRVLASEVLATIQGVPGVEATDLEELYAIDDSGNPVLPPVAAALAAHRATPSGGDVAPAELLLLAEGEAGITLEVMAP